MALPTVRSSSTSNELVSTDKPTLLLFLEVCQEHKRTYDLTYWMSHTDWVAMQRLAESNGYKIEDQNIIQVHFRPINWEPSMKWMEMERN